MIKRILKSMLKRFDIIAFKRSSRVFLPEDESYRIVATLLERHDPVVIDGGAHRGDMVERLRALLPQAEFHCFEPDPVLGEMLAHQYANDPNVHVNRVALGDVATKASLHVNVSRATNSLFETADALQPDIKQLSTTVDRVEVDVTTIDDYCRDKLKKPVDVIKLDLQGYDLNALKGAADTLRQTTVVLVEVLFEEIYKGCPGFKDILDFMVGRGFRLYTLCGLHYGQRDELMWADAVFIRC